MSGERRGRGGGRRVPVGVLAQQRDDGRVGERDGGRAEELADDDEQQQQEERLLDVGRAVHDVGVQRRDPVALGVGPVVDGVVHGQRRADARGGPAEVARRGGPGVVVARRLQAVGRVVERRHARHGRRLHPAQRQREHDPRAQRRQQQRAALAPAVGQPAPEGRRQELHEGPRADEQAALARVHAHLLEVHAHQREQRAERRVEEEVERLDGQQLGVHGARAAHQLQHVAAPAHLVRRLLRRRVPAHA